MDTVTERAKGGAYQATAKKSGLKDTGAGLGNPLAKPALASEYFDRTAIIYSTGEHHGH
jgi:hypothetical protein